MRDLKSRMSRVHDFRSKRGFAFDTCCYLPLKACKIDDGFQVKILFDGASILSHTKK